MKKQLLGVMVCLIGLSAVAQKQNLSFGPTAGFGHAWMSNTDNGKYKPAGNVGVSLIYSSHPHIGFGGDLKFSIEGNKTEVGVQEVENTLNYVRVPLKVIYFFGEFGDRLRPKIAVGPSFGFLVGGKKEISNNHALVSKTDAKDLYKGFDAGIGALAGLNYRLVRNTWFVAEVNYYNGLTNINDVANLNNKNRNLGLNIGVNFGIGTATKSK